MKRLFGLIGLTYLSVLAVVFYFYNFSLIIVLFIISVLSICTGFALLIFKKCKNIFLDLIIIGITAVCACLSIFLYTNIVYKPVVNNYSDREIKISGYICDEVIKTENSCKCIIETYTVNDEDKKLKILLVSYADLGLNHFDKINAVVNTFKVPDSSLKSKGIFLRAYPIDGFTIEKTGDRQPSVYSFAVDLRLAMKKALDCLLPEDYSSLCKAVLLGDKQSLSYDIRNDFTVTGTSFLIVVSGMHLAIITAFVLFFIRKITHSRYIRAVSVFVTVTAFMALTGFAPSIIRAGIMLIITYGASITLRRADPLNSLGISAIILTLFNPYAAGDAGLLLSFAATAGIILWSQNIYNYIVSFLKLKNKFLITNVRMLSVSLSASIWIVPITVMVFNKVSPFVVIVSVIAESFVSVLIICSLLASLFYIFPFVSFLAYPFALAAGLVSKLVLFIISIFSAFSYSSINTDKFYFYVWLAVTIVLTAAGFIIKEKKFYIKCAVTASFIILIGGWSIFSFVTADDISLTVYSVNNGVSAAVSSGKNITVISCGGSNDAVGEITEDIESNFIKIDNIVVPNMKHKYSAYQSILINEFDAANVLVYDKDSRMQKLLYDYDGRSRFVFGDNIHFKLHISDSVTDDVININGVTYQYVKGKGKSMLFVPSGGKIADLPEKYRKADYLLIDSIPDNVDLLNCRTVVFSGNIKRYNSIYNDLKKLDCKILKTTDEKVILSLN